MLNLSKHNLVRPIVLQASIEHRLRAEQKSKESISVISEYLEKGYENWIITFSGGKDSTSSLIVSLETALKYADRLKRIDVVYSDTGVEIPSINNFAINFINGLKKNPRLKSLNIKTHILHPRLEHSFWVKLLGKGYPPPHQKFRWCTHRLKIRPVEDKLGKFIVPDKTIIITGVRFGESKERDKRLNASCARGGECGQGLWFQYSSKLKAGYLAPLIDWTSCDVWDFLTFLAPSLGYDTLELPKIYNGHDTRFGCWTCTVVRQDKAMERTIAQPEWEYLKPLADFRIKIWQITRPKESRILRSDGQPGRLKLSIRKKLLRQLLIIQTDLKLKLINESEIDMIIFLWESETGKAKLK